MVALVVYCPRFSPLRASSAERLTFASWVTLANILPDSRYHSNLPPAVAVHHLVAPPALISPFTPERCHAAFLGHTFTRLPAPWFPCLRVVWVGLPPRFCHGLDRCLPTTTGCYAAPFGLACPGRLHGSIGYRLHTPGHGFFSYL